MSNSDLSSVVTLGAISVLNGYCALDKLLETANIHATVLQTQLANTPEITEQMLKSAKDITAGLTSGDYTGLAAAVMAGITGGMAIYYACRREK
ncbi:hypothetical protein ACFL0X_02995 [Nanoarchaeota archaeon]